MNNKELVAFMNLLMCTDPWPKELHEKEHTTLIQLADRESRDRGFENWIVAYYEIPQSLKICSCISDKTHLHSVCESDSPEFVIQTVNRLCRVVDYMAEVHGGVFDPDSNVLPESTHNRLEYLNARLNYVEQIIEKDDTEQDPVKAEDKSQTMGEEFLADVEKVKEQLDTSAVDAELES